jgi:uncharacterized protein YecE (DUF72 family)
VLIVGTSGWQYKDWKGLFYPPGVAELPFYAAGFMTVELNNSFYRLPSYDTFAQWRSATPADFVFAVKMSRYLTHIKRLRDPAEPVERFLRHACGLGPKLGPVLLQLPPTLPFDKEALHAVLSLFPQSVQVAVEPRHESWWSSIARSILEKHGAALCWADRRGRPVTPLWRTADFGYVRLHEGRANPRPRYGRTALHSWLERIVSAFGTDPVYVYFNNDPGGAALHDATALARIAAYRGIEVTRTP